METKQQPTLQFEQINHQLSNIVLEKIKKTTTENENENKDEEAVTFTYTYRSKLPDIHIPNHLPLHDYCFENMGKFGPKRACIIYGPTGRVYSYAEVQQSSRRLALGLHRRLGVGRGDVIMLCLQNCPEFVFGFLAASQLGAMATTANPLCTAAEIGKQAAASQAKIVLVPAAFAEKVSGIGSNDVVVVVVGGENNNNVEKKKDQGLIAFEELINSAGADGDDKLPEVEFQPDDVVALPYSSGTTGLPKGVMLTHKGLVTSVAQQVDGDNPNLYLHSDDVVLCVLPLFHIYSLNSILLCSLRVGAAILIMPKFDVRTMLELVQRHKVSIVPIVPPICLDLAKSPDTSLYDVSSIRTIMSGGAPMGKDLEEVVKSKFPNVAIGQGYGMTEAGPVLAMNLAFAKEPMPVKSGACGTVVRNAELKIVDPETGKSQPRNKPGEICIRGDQIMKGYLNDEKATANTIDEDGWLHTGDVGYVDDDDEIFIVDRLKELIKFKGFQVAPAELEGMLINHPHVSDAAVIGMKDEAKGEIPVAFIVKSNGTRITEDDIKKYISNQVVYYKRLGKVFFVDSIPKLPSGKILRKELRARLANIAAASALSN